LRVQNENVVPQLHRQPKTEGDGNSTRAKLSCVLRTVARQRQLPHFVSSQSCAFIKVRSQLLLGRQLTLVIKNTLSFISCTSGEAIVTIFSDVDFSTIIHAIVACRLQ